MRDISNYNLKAHNTFGIDAQCRRFLEYTTTEEAQAVSVQLRNDLRRPSAGQQPFLIIGGGSNLLLTRDYEGTVVHSAIKGRVHDVQGDTVLLTAGSGENWDDLVDYCVKNGWYGMENLSLIPGDVGASAVQNIGAYGAEAKDLIVEVEAVEITTARVVTIPASECQYGYRQSRFKQEWKDRYLITHVTYRLSTHFSPRLDYGNIRTELERKNIIAPTAAELRQVIIDIRREKLPDPEVEGNAGSFFMNPVVDRAKYEALAGRYDSVPHYDVDADRVKIPAGWMIDQCGWKGRSLGRAGVHDRQALVLVNRGGATGKEIVALCHAIQKDVEEQFGIVLRPEVNII
ncbi:MAG: UDP-N-acetylmuramate dehydrogenase [Prevotella sp.]|nr:UDP-N-acetylmuramate dehydrogenase [Prevotella sp.]